MLKSSLLLIQTILILCLAAYIFLLRECSRCPKCQDCSQVSVDTNYLPGDPAPKEVPVSRPHKRSYPIAKTITDRPAPSGQDSYSMVKQYAQSLYYSDTIHAADSSWLAIINDSLQYNRISWRAFLFQQLKGPTVITKTVTKPAEPVEARRRIYAGLQLNLLPADTMVTPGISLLYQSRKDHIYSYAYDPFRNVHTLSAYWLISFRKKK